MFLIDNFKEIPEFTFNFLSEKIINFDSKKNIIKHIKNAPK